MYRAAFVAFITTNQTQIYITTVGAGGGAVG
jgi:hypothetical protein